MEKSAKGKASPEKKEKEKKKGKNTRHLANALFYEKHLVTERVSPVPEKLHDFIVRSAAEPVKIQATCQSAACRQRSFEQRRSPPLSLLLPFPTTSRTTRCRGEGGVNGRIRG